MKLNMTEIYGDGFGINQINSKDNLKGYTTNPTLVRNLEIKSYSDYSKQMISKAFPSEVHIEVLSDEIEVIKSQARMIQAWGKNAVVKVPFYNSMGKKLVEAIRQIHNENINVNITALMQEEDVAECVSLIKNKSNIFLSIFAGRIADTGRDPIPFIESALDLSKKNENIRVIWASPREVYNIHQAQSVNCDIITCPVDMINKYRNLQNYDLKKFSIETAQMFINDASKSNFSIQ